MSLLKLSKTLQGPVQNILNHNIKAGKKKLTNELWDDNLSFQKERLSQKDVFNSIH